MDPRDLFNAKDVKKSTRFSVFGYIRECETMFDTDNPYYNIPELVCYICISYLAEIEYFTVVSEGIKLDNEDKRIKKKEDAIGAYVAGYGNVDINMEIDECIHQWKFRVISSMADIINFGIDYSQKQHLNSFVGQEDKQLGVGDWTFEYNADDGLNGVESYGEVPEFHVGEVVTMELNCNTYSLDYYVNDDIDSKFGFNGVIGGDRIYNMVVSLTYTADTVELLEYQTISMQ